MGVDSEFLPTRKPARGALRSFAWAAISRAGRVPVAGGVVRLAYHRYFDAAHGTHIRLFRGVFATFAAARQAIRPGRRESYDNAPSAQRVIDEWLNIDPSDYPVMFWLKSIPGSRLLFDWGGNVGLKYFAYRTYLKYPPELEWLVCDVPAVVALGREIAAREGATRLRFTVELEELAQADILLAAGSLHFIEDPLAQLARCAALPKHVILSKVPAYDRASAVTLHNMGTALCPYHLFNRAQFVAAFEGLGYVLIDEWQSPNVGCEIPFHPDHSVAAYSGFYFAKPDELTSAVSTPGHH